MWLAGVAAAVAATGILVPAAGAAPAVPAAPGADGGQRLVSVRHLPAPWSGACASGRDGMSYETAIGPSSFVLRILVLRPRCTPLRATAAVYGMPADGSVWPQDLIDTAPVVIAGAGVTEVTFARTCTPAQFDVVTGATPDRIAPWEQWHGPLLFPLDTRSAFQDDATTCADAPPSTSPPTGAGPVTSPPSSPDEPATSTSDPTGEGPAGPTGPSTSAGTGEIEVLAATTVPSRPEVVDAAEGAPPVPKVAGLALTGATAAVLVASGILLVLFGVGFVVGAWFRTRARGDRRTGLTADRG